MTLIHLIYVSSARQEMDGAGLDRILEASVRNNVSRGVTGMLVYSAGSFMQLLEGEAAAVDEIYRLIGQDRRHHTITLLERAAIKARSFDRWSMGFKRLGADDRRVYAAWAPLFESGFNAAEIGAAPGVALSMLTDFCQRQSG